jgi:hypothetical protein
MLSYVELASLRLRDLLGPDAQIIEHDGWHWMGQDWWYEGVGFTWFGRLEAAPDETVALELNLEELPSQMAALITGAIGLRLTQGMTLNAVVAELGPSLSVQQFVKDRVTHQFSVGQSDLYRVSATIHTSKGLIHVSAVKAFLAESE